MAGLCSWKYKWLIVILQIFMGAQNIDGRDGRVEETMWDVGFMGRKFCPDPIPTSEWCKVCVLYGLSRVTSLL